MWAQRGWQMLPFEAISLYGTEKENDRNVFSLQIWNYFQALGFCLLKSQDQVLKSKEEVNLGSHLVCVPGSSPSVSPTGTTHSTLKEHSQGGARADWQPEALYLRECLDIWCLIFGQDKSDGIYNVLLGFLTTKKKRELCGDAGVPNIKVRVILQSVQFSSVAQSCPTLCNSMDCSTSGLPVYHQLLEFTQTHVHWFGDAIQSSHPLSSPSPPAFNLSQHQGLFKWVSSFHQVAKVLEFQLQHQSFQWSFRTDFL